MTDNVREALEAWPMHRLLRSGVMDLKPMLAKHLAETLTLGPPPDSDALVGALVDQLVRLIGQWRTLATTPGGEPYGVCADALQSLLEGDGEDDGE
ncbi:hypothetical protein [Gordonia soli]|uniref:Uncharacterized protein n=1 Tax=Gordonia soli NBRC 108243 TaxID=1223545 RepID=M0QQS0_9ACTN|nr:hypothetical protein [Gordonia soli]GAC70744.1 hypothetical protein GS4_40_00120 [Gordonia soli NBRC 108243]